MWIVVGSVTSPAPPDGSYHYPHRRILRKANTLVIHVQWRMYNEVKKFKGAVLHGTQFKVTFKSGPFRWDPISDRFGFDTEREFLCDDFSVKVQGYIHFPIDKTIGSAKLQLLMT